MKTIDIILDKISSSGISSLTDFEKQCLEAYSMNLPLPALPEEEEEPVIPMNSNTYTETKFYSNKMYDAHENDLKSTQYLSIQNFTIKMSLHNRNYDMTDFSASYDKDKCVLHVTALVNHSKLVTMRLTNKSNTGLRNFMLQDVSYFINDGEFSEFSAEIEEPEEFKLFMNETAIPQILHYLHNINV